MNCSMLSFTLEMLFSKCCIRFIPGYMNIIPSIIQSIKKIISFYRFFVSIVELTAACKQVLSRRHCGKGHCSTTAGGIILLINSSLLSKLIYIFGVPVFISIERQCPFTKSIFTYENDFFLHICFRSLVRFAKLKYRGQYNFLAYCQL